MASITEKVQRELGAGLEQGVRAARRLTKARKAAWRKLQRLHGTMQARTGVPPPASAYRPNGVCGTPRASATAACGTVPRYVLIPVMMCGTAVTAFSRP